MKSCVSLHRFRISADPLGGWFKFSELWGRAAPPACSVASASSVTQCAQCPQRAQCPQLKKAALFFAGRAAPYNPPREIICLCASTTHLIFLNVLHCLCLNHVWISYIQARYSKFFDGSRA